VSSSLGSNKLKFDDVCDKFKEMKVPRILVASKK